MEGDHAESGDAGGPGKCQKGEPPVSAIVLMAEEAVERERRRGQRKPNQSGMAKGPRRGCRKLEHDVTSSTKMRTECNHFCKRKRAALVVGSRGRAHCCWFDRLKGPYNNQPMKKTEQNMAPISFIEIIYMY